MDLKELFTSLPPADFFKEKSVFIAGCGGLGGYLAAAAARCGFGRIVLCDFDKFDATNLNRQFGCTESTIGRPKAQVTEDMIKDINPKIRVVKFRSRITSINCRRLISGCDIILDGLDSRRPRLCLGAAAEAEGIPLVHGAVEGWRCQAALIPPGSGMLKRLYAGRRTPRNTPVLSFAPAFCAALQVNMAVSFLAGKYSLGYGRLIIVNLHSFSVDICDI